MKQTYQSRLNCLKIEFNGVENMGNIRPSFIKIRAIRLVEEHGEHFTDDFDHNKKMVQKLTDVGNNKRMRNWIAGYVTRYRQRRTD